MNMEGIASFDQLSFSKILNLKGNEIFILYMVRDPLPVSPFLFFLMLTFVRLPGVGT